ncbi:MAG: YfcE family phosphodiesterase [Desulfobacterium sp.]|nr:YfcE family phosphodiesterase [Desulfobacterium sp.]
MMGRLIVTADVHGSLSTWRAVRALVKKDDTLVVAGDLFDTRYGRSGPDFKPLTIKHEIASLGTRFCYVYGNCDVPAFFPGYTYELEFSHSGTSILLIHGHAPVTDLPDQTTLIIQGHTHIPKLEKTDGFTRLNPGSLTSPRVGAPTYAIVENNRATLMDIQTNTPLIRLAL